MAARRNTVAKLRTRPGRVMTEEIELTVNLACAQDLMDAVSYYRELIASAHEPNELSPEAGYTYERLGQLWRALDDIRSYRELRKKLRRN